MLEEIKLKSLNALVEGLSQEELIWLNGYMAGLVKVSQSETKGIPVVGKITILFGTETGNSKKLATAFAAKSRKIGLTAKLSSMDQYKLSDLEKEEILLIIISTHGDGEPPAAAKKFYDHLQSNQLNLSKLKYSVLALGDTAYPLFCKAGEDVDAKLGSFGALSLQGLQKCDVDYEQLANEWFDLIVVKLSAKRSTEVKLPTVSTSRQKKLYEGKIISKLNLNGKGSLKETFHIEIEANELQYEPGDSIGITPENPVATVKSIINLTGVNGSETILFIDQEILIEESLKKKLNIFFLAERIVKKYAAIVNQEIPAIRMDLLDLIKIYSPKNAEQFKEILLVLEPIAPRLYSISSSLMAHSGEVHITVARNCFQLDQELRHGLCSNYLSEFEEGARINFYVHNNLQFKLPPADRDIIMIGPGTGVAPFRAFIEDRANTGAIGKSWLFFGDQHFTSDFLYQTEWQGYLASGILTKMNVAFSRDQQEKIYVQHKMLDHAAELYNWLMDGAYIFVCGAKSPMSVDVENAILKILQLEGSLSGEESQNFLNQLNADGRYVKDVY